MAQINKVAGTASLVLSGEQLQLKGQLVIRIAGRERPAVVGQDGQVHGYKEETQAPMITCVLTPGQTLDLQALAELDGETVQADLHDGRSAVLREAWVSNDFELDAAEGELTVEFTGKSGRWLT